MTNYTEESLTKYLMEKGVEFKERGGELVTRCIFSSCDEDSRPNEAHLYFNQEGLYHCKKCDEKGNLKTLMQFFGDEQRMKTNKKTGQKSKKSKIMDDLVSRCNQALPEDMRKYLNGRGITDSLIQKYKIGYGSFYGKSWITIPIKDKGGEWSLIKLRKLPNDEENPDKFKVYPAGAKHEIYGWEVLANQPKQVVVCEGEFDRLLLMEKDIDAISSTGGAGTFKPAWITALTKVNNVYFIYDIDQAGRENVAKIELRLMETGTSNVFDVELPVMEGDGKDITDYKMLGGDVGKLLSLAKEVSLMRGDRVVQIERPYNPTSIEEWRAVIEKHFLHCLFPAEVCLSIIAQILITDITNPFGLVLVDVPSAGKTITLNFFDGIRELVYASDNFTTASFVSNAANVSAEKLKEVDLLPRLRNKAFLVRDMATIFSKREDDLKQSLGVLTRVFDGEGLQTDSGVHGARKYVGEFLFMFIAASTPIPNKIWKIMGSLGSRLFFLNMHSPDKTMEELADQLVGAPFKKKEKECAQITKDYVYTLWKKYPKGIEWKTEHDPKECRVVIARCSKLLASLRGVITVWKERRNDEGEIDFDYSPPIIEKPDRINQLFYNLCRGHALVSGRENINKEDLRLIVELAIDSAPTTRAQLFRLLVDNGGVLKTTEVEELLSCSKPTALKEMKTLEALGVARITEDKTMKVGNTEKCIQLKKDFTWFLSNECREIRGLPQDPEQDTMAYLLNQ